MYCPKCGCQNQDSSDYCVRCGTSLSEARANLTSPPGAGPAATASPPAPGHTTGPAPPASRSQTPAQVTGEVIDAAAGKVVDGVVGVAKEGLGCIGIGLLIAFIPSLLLGVLMLLFGDVGQPPSITAWVIVILVVIIWLSVRGARRRG